MLLTFFYLHCSFLDLTIMEYVSVSELGLQLLYQKSTACQLWFAVSPP